MLTDEVCQQSCMRMMECLDHEIQHLQAQIDQLIAQDTVMSKNAQLLMSIPAIGKATMAWLIAYLSDVHRFKCAKKVACFFGLTPIEYQSGTSVLGKSRISKIGQADLRRILFMPAMVAGFNPRSRNNPFLSFVQRLKAKGKSNLVIITALMRKLLTIAFAVLKTQTPFDEKLH